MIHQYKGASVDQSNPQSPGADARNSKKKSSSSLKSTFAPVNKYIRTNKARKWSICAPPHSPTFQTLASNLF
jgi:hypothetical protein